MPIYQFKCLKTNEIAEIILPISESDRKYIYCPIHTIKNENNEEINWHDAERIPSLFNTTQEAPPTIVFQNENGHIKLAASKYDRPPEGYEKVEIKGSIARSAIEHSLNKQQEIEDEIITERVRQIRDETMKNRHADLEANMSKLASESDHPTGAERFIRSAINRSKGKSVPKKKSEFKFDVNHKDSSSMKEG